ncbi:MAG: TolC family protein [Planctomycetota bacterium]
MKSSLQALFTWQGFFALLTLGCAIQLACYCFPSKAVPLQANLRNSDPVQVAIQTTASGGPANGEVQNSERVDGASPNSHRIKSDRAANQESTIQLASFTGVGAPQQPQPQERTQYGMTQRRSVIPPPISGRYYTHPSSVAGSTLLSGRYPLGESQLLQSKSSQTLDAEKIYGPGHAYPLRRSENSIPQPSSPDNNTSIGKSKSNLTKSPQKGFAVLQGQPVGSRIRGRTGGNSDGGNSAIDIYEGVLEIARTTPRPSSRNFRSHQPIRQREPDLIRDPITVPGTLEDQKAMDQPMVEPIILNQIEMVDLPEISDSANTFDSQDVPAAVETREALAESLGRNLQPESQQEFLTPSTGSNLEPTADSVWVDSSTSNDPSELVLNSPETSGSPQPTISSESTAPSSPESTAPSSPVVNWYESPNQLEQAISPTDLEVTPFADLPTYEDPAESKDSLIQVHSMEPVEPAVSAPMRSILVRSNASKVGESSFQANGQNGQGFKPELSDPTAEFLSERNQESSDFNEAFDSRELDGTFDPNQFEAALPSEVIEPEKLDGAFEAPNFKPLKPQQLPIPKFEDPNWWVSQIHRPQLVGRYSLPATLDEVIFVALKNAPQVQILNTEPRIQQTIVNESVAQFDWNLFIDTAWNEVDEPTGDDLQTGVPGRFVEKEWTYEAGLSRLLKNGGDFRIGQSFGIRDNNSTFLNPPNQGNSSLVLDYRQPLLRGRGRNVATSQIAIANFDLSTVQGESLTELQQYLIDVVSAYWDIYRQRALLIQQLRSVSRAQLLLNKLNDRLGIDVTNDQLLRAEAAVAARRTDVIRTEYNLINAQDRLLNLTMGQVPGKANHIEIIPEPILLPYGFVFNNAQLLQVAIQNRPEIEASLAEVKAASVRTHVAQNDLLPRLDAILSTNVNGIRGNRNTGGAFRDQFTAGNPSYSAGLSFELPVGNRAAKSRLARAELEAEILVREFQKTVGDVTLDVRIASRNIYRLNMENANNLLAVQKAAEELALIRQRQELNLDDNRTGSLYIEDVLASQGRLTAAENRLANSQVEQAIAIIDLKRATGELLRNGNRTLGSQGFIPTQYTPVFQTNGAGQTRLPHPAAPPIPLPQPPVGPVDYEEPIEGESFGEFGTTFEAPTSELPTNDSSEAEASELAISRLPLLIDDVSFEIAVPRIELGADGFVDGPVESFPY